MVDEYIHKADAWSAVEQANGNTTWAERDDCHKRLEQLKPADVVPVVRCEDCKHHSFDAGYDNYWCNLTSGARKVKRFDFCSYGERKEEYEAD